MAILLIAVVCAFAFFAAYRLYGSLLARLLRLDPSRPTPAVAQRDDVDFVPTEPKFLMSQHFSAIAAAGPIAGPILAGVWFGWGPTLAWIVIGAIFVGGVHDITSLVASLRHDGKSIAEILRLHMSRRSYLLFLAFIWMALVYIIVAFTDIVATSFVGVQQIAGDTVVTGGGIAASSLMYLALPVVMGLLLRYTKLSVGWATVIFLPLVAAAIWAGPYVPLDLAKLLNLTDAQAVKMWDVLLLGYCLVAGGVPVWLLLQPRGHLGGYFLYVALLGSVLGIVVLGVGSALGMIDHAPTLSYPAFTSWNTAAGPLMPMLVITVACGACSGFHCLIASGTTSKQLRSEADAKLIGYGTMVLEGMVAVISLVCVMILTTEAAKGKGPNVIYAQGLGTFFGALGVPAAFAVAFGLLAFTTFVYDTLDVCTRLGRYTVQELTGWHGAGGRWFGTAVTALVPLIFVMQTMHDPVTGNPKPAWAVFWPLFGASNQLLAALALLCVTVWLWRTRRVWWVWLVTGVPMVWMYAMSVWALALFVTRGFFRDGEWVMPGDPVPYASVVLILLAIMLMVEAVTVFFGRPPSDAEPAPLAEPA